MNRLAAAVALVLPLTACDLALLPETAEYVDGGAARLDLSVHATTMPGSEVQAVEIEIDDLQLHRVEDDAWIIVAPETTRVEFTAQTPQLAVDDVPIDRATYDAVVVGISRVRVASGNIWHVADLGQDELVFDIDVDVQQQLAVALEIDLDASVAGAGEDWAFDPVTVLSIGEQPDPAAAP